MGRWRTQDPGAATVLPSEVGCGGIGCAVVAALTQFSHVALATFRSPILSFSVSRIALLSLLGMLRVVRFRHEGIGSVSRG